MDETADILSRSDSPTPPRRAWRVIGIIALLGFLALLGLGIFLDVYGQQERVRPAEVIIVLGSRVSPDGQPGDSLRARTLHAIDLYRRHLASALLFTGGQGSDEPRAESAVARDLAMQNGVPPSAIFLETASTNTRENARFAAAICREQGWTTAIVVSDPYHVWRGRRNLRQEGITAYPSPAVHCERNRKWLLRVQWTARETLAILRDVATGH
jgi:uncharacterized SAM-binding protein YcdF (DUF218 family)